MAMLTPAQKPRGLAKIIFTDFLPPGMPLSYPRLIFSPSRVLGLWRQVFNLPVASASWKLAATTLTAKTVPGKRHRHPGNGWRWLQAHHCRHQTLIEFDAVLVR